MLELMQSVMPLCGLEDPETWPNSCHLSCYSQDDGLPWHADDQPIFCGTTQRCPIICLSLCGKRFLELRRNGEIKDSNTSCKVEVSGGDIYTMEGMTQAHYQHRVSYKGGVRLSLTWRWIVAHDG